MNHLQVTTTKDLDINNLPIFYVELAGLVADQKVSAAEKAADKCSNRELLYQRTP